MIATASTAIMLLLIVIIVGYIVLIDYIPPPWNYIAMMVIPSALVTNLIYEILTMTLNER